MEAIEIIECIAEGGAPIDRNEFSSSRGSSSSKTGSAGSWKNDQLFHPLPRWQSGCYSKYGCGTCTVPSCPYLHDLTPAEAEELLSWNRSEQHVVFQSEYSASNSNSQNTSGSSMSSEKVGRDVANLTSADHEDYSQVVRRLRMQYKQTGDKKLRALLPRDQAGNATTIGSLLHASGKCKPCRYVIAGQPCPDRLRCCFCHLHSRRSMLDCKVNIGAIEERDDEPRSTSNLRPCKARRDRYKIAVQRATSQIEADPFGWNLDSIEVPSHVANDPQLKNKFLVRLMSISEAARARSNSTSRGAASSSVRTGIASSSTDHADRTMHPQEQAARQQRGKRIMRL